MTTFSKKLNEVRESAIAYILSVLEQRGTNYELIDPTSYEEEEETEDEVYTLPRGFTVSKYGNYREFPIVIINIEKNKLSFVGIPVLAEGEDEDATFKTDDLSTDVLCAIATLVEKFEK